MRVNARLDDESAARIRYLTETTGSSVSAVLREALEHYYAQVRHNQRLPRRLLAMAGTASSGRSDVAGNVKKHVAEILEAKFRLADRARK